MKEVICSADSWDAAREDLGGQGGKQEIAADFGVKEIPKL